MTGLVDIVNLDQLLNHDEHQFHWRHNSTFSIQLVFSSHFGPYFNSTLIHSGKSRPDHPVAGFFAISTFFGGVGRDHVWRLESILSA